MNSEAPGIPDKSHADKKALADKKMHFQKSLIKAGAYALVAAIIIDAVYFLVFPGDGLPGKLGWLLLIVPNLFFAFGIAMFTVLIRRNYREGWLLKPYGDAWNPVNALILGLLFTCVVAGAVFTLFMVYGGTHVVDAVVALKDALFAQPEESFYIGAKVLGTSLAADGGGKVEDQPPR